MASPRTYALLAYGSWGLLPLFWKLLIAVPAWQILEHRVYWSSLFFFGLFSYRKVWPELFACLKQHPILILISSFLIGSNWYIYIYAVNAGHILETSLGYFINPLLSIGLGTVVFREKLSRVQIFSVVLALIGLGFYAQSTAGIPWVAFYLALSFSGYGLLRKFLRMSALNAVGLEALILATVLALGAFINHSDKPLFPDSFRLSCLLVLGGLLTAWPLVWFSQAAKVLKLSTLGFFQYLSPTLQFLIALFVFHEPFEKWKLAAFACTWIGIALILVTHARSPVESNYE